MKIKIVKKDNLDIVKYIKRCGYAELKDRRTGQTSFIHRLGLYFYPRFHLYIAKESPTEFILTLHLDQKRPSYAGQRAHSGEYEGKLVEEEAARIKNYIENVTK